jgi:[protein-PII] uridylyltransferase
MLDRHRTELGRMLEDPQTAGLPLARRHAQLMDALLASLLPAAETAAQHEARGRLPLLLGAVGSYGRGELGCGSDIDVRFLVADDPESAGPFVEAFLYPLWDAGIRVGHQVITVEDAVEMAWKDLPTATALLDWRPIAGDGRLGKLLEAGAYETIFHPTTSLSHFIDRLEESTARRHERFGDSVYLLEPDVKSGTGGLRDLDVALWAGRARFRARGIDGLADAGVLLPAEADGLRRAADFMWRVRNHLHFVARRQSDRLSFEQQETIAARLGYRERIGATAHATETQIAGAMAESFMSDYYRHARVVARGLSQLLTRSRPRGSSRPPRVEPLGPGVRAVDGSVCFEPDLDLGKDPAATLRLYAIAVSRRMPVEAEARDRIIRAIDAPGCAQTLCESPEAARLFTGLVCTAQEGPFKNGSIVGELHDVGLLTAMIPEFTPVVGRVHHDVYHVYTVDVHSVAAVDRLCALVRGDLAGPSPLACRLAAEIARPEVLFMATLLHDVGKALGGQDHAEHGAEMSQRILERLGFEQDDIDEVCHLVREHLRMYRVAVRRDFHEPAALEEFLEAIHGREGLRELYLLTVADVSTTSPTAMTRWKASMLEELFLTADAALSGARLDRDTRRTRLREQTRSLWGERDRAFVDEFIDSMPERYLISNSPAEIVAHAQVALSSRDSPVGAAVVPSRHVDVAELCIVAGGSSDGAELCVVTSDRPGLLASIAAVLSARGLEIHAAQVHSRRLKGGGSQAVDLFWVRSRSEGAEGVRRALPKLQDDLRRVVTGAMQPDELVPQRSGSRWAERPTPTVHSKVVIDHRASSVHTVIEVLTKDQPGMLWALARALHDLDLVISVAKINTEGTRVADVFYVTEIDGSKVSGETRIAAIREQLSQVLASMDASAPSSERRALRARVG